MMESVAPTIAVLVWGGVATTALAAVFYASRSLGLSRLDFPLLLGTAFTSDRRSAVLLGLLLWFLGGWLFAFFYFLLFALIGHAGVLVGALIGAIHAVLLLAVPMTALPYLHPRVASEEDSSPEMRKLEPPGFLGMHYGWHTPLVAIVAQATYGAILGGGLAMN